MLAYDSAIDAVAAIDRLSFDQPFTIDAHGIVTAYGDHPDVYPPTVTTCAGRPDNRDDLEIDGGEQWEAMTGLTGQYGYDGPILHTSEVMSPGVVRAMINDQGDERWIFVLSVVSVDCCDDCPPFDACDRDHEPAGWTILHMPDPARRMTYWEAEDAFEEWINDTDDTVTIMGLSYDPGRVLRVVDPVAFRCGMVDWADAEDIEIV